MAETLQFVPLSWPDENLKKAGLYHLHKKAQNAFKEMQRIVKDRDLIPLEIWDNNSKRQEVAKRLSQIIKSNVGWISDNFIPDDPFDLLCWGGMYDLQEVEIILDIERCFVINIQEADYEFIWNFTLGQFVDYLLGNAACPEYWPKNGENGLEKKYCPSMAAFLDMRNFIKAHCTTKQAELVPSSNVIGLMDDRNIILLKNYICERFGVKPIAQKRFLKILPPTKTWLITNVIIAFVIRWRLPSLEWCYILCLMIPILFLVGVFVGRLSFLTLRGNITTMRDLTKWIIRQRTTIQTINSG